MRRLCVLIACVVLTASCGHPLSATGSWIIKGSGPDDRDIQLTLGANGTFSLDDKCNTQQGSWTISGRDIALTNVSMTAALCVRRPDVIGSVLSGRLIDSRHLVIDSMQGTFSLGRQ